MSLGVCMKAFNTTYFKQVIDFRFEFIPQLILLLSLFGYMDLLIIIKWLTWYPVFEGKGELAPSIISQMISMGLKLGAAEG
jgi:V-type H+-transporting ATPase subunit a